MILTLMSSDDFDGLYRCIYEYDDEHSIGGEGFKEADPPNFMGSFYSETKGMVEKVSSRQNATARYVSHLTRVTND